MELRQFLIVFEGDVCEESRRWLSNHIRIGVVFAFTFSGIIVSIPFWVLCINNSDWLYMLFLIPCYLPGPLLITIIVLFPNKTKQPPPIYVAIIKDTMIAKVKINNGSIIKYGNSVEHVKKVIDFGDWYFISFHIFHKNPSFICQKDLIKEGTIEEFEELFKDKIVRKKQKGDKGHEEV